MGIKQIQPVHPETRPIFTPKQRRRMVLSAGSAFHFFHDGLADGLSVFLPLWQGAFGLSMTQVGLLVSCFEGGTGFFQIPAGFLGERFGERKLLAAGALISGLAFALVGFAGGLISLFCFLFISGLGATVQHPLSSSMISRAYHEHGRRMALGTYNFLGDIGKFLFPAFAALALVHMSWRPVCMGFGLFGCLLSVVLLVGLKHVLEEKTPSEESGREKDVKEKGWGIINKGAFSTLSAIAVIDTTVRAALITFAPFLFIQKGIRPESVGFALSLLLIGGAGGRLLCGILAERVGSALCILVTEAVTGGGILLLTILPAGFLYIFLPVLGAALMGTSSALYGSVGDFVSPDKVARVFGLFYTFVIGAAAVAPPLLGGINDMLGVVKGIQVIGWIALSSVPMAVLLWRQTTPA